MKYKRFVTQTKFASHFLPRPLRAARIKKIVNHLHRTVKTEHTLCFQFEKIRYCRDRVRTRERMMNRRAITRVATEQRAVRAVQGRHDTRLLFRRQHRAGEDGRGGVWNSIMDVHDIQTVIAANLGHANRKRQSIIRIFEKRVVVYYHGMERKTRCVFRQSERALIADKMHLVPALGEFFAQRCCEDAAAADRGITGDADVHLRFRIFERCDQFAPAS